MSNRSKLQAVTLRSAGFSLVEVLVAVVVTAIGVMGAAALQLSAIKFNQTADMRSQATVLAYDIADRMRANRESALSGDYELALSDAAPSGSAVHQIDLRDWLSALASRMPAGDGSIDRDQRSFTITVQWDESRVANSREADADGDHLQQFVFVTEL